MKTWLEGKPGQLGRLRGRMGGVRALLLMLLQGCAQGVSTSCGGFGDEGLMIKRHTRLGGVVTVLGRLYSHDNTCPYRTESHCLGGDLMTKGGTQLQCVATVLGRKYSSGNATYWWPTSCGNYLDGYTALKGCAQLHCVVILPRERYLVESLTIKGGTRLHCVVTLFGGCYTCIENSINDLFCQLYWTDTAYGVMSMWGVKRSRVAHSCIV